LEEDTKIKEDRIIRVLRFGRIRSLCIPFDWRHKGAIREVTGWASSNGVGS